jgi:hypothetical protein
MPKQFLLFVAFLLVCNVVVIVHFPQMCWESSTHEENPKLPHSDPLWCLSLALERSLAIRKAADHSDIQSEAEEELVVMELE